MVLCQDLYKIYFKRTCQLKSMLNVNINSIVSEFGIPQGALI